MTIICPARHPIGHHGHGKHGRRMSVDQPDIENELGAPCARELLASTSAAHFAYTGRDGTPRVIPVGFFWTGEQFVIATATTAPKVAALSARPAVGLAIDAGDHFLIATAPTAPKVAALSARPDFALAIDAGDTPEQARALSIRGRASVQIVDGVVPQYLPPPR